MQCKTQSTSIKKSDKIWLSFDWVWQSKHNNLDWIWLFWLLNFVRLCSADINLTIPRLGNITWSSSHSHFWCLENLLCKRCSINRKERMLFFLASPSRTLTHLMVRVILSRSLISISLQITRLKKLLKSGTWVRFSGFQFQASEIMKIDISGLSSKT